MATPRSYGRWRGFSDIVAALLGNPGSAHRMDAAFAALSAETAGAGLVAGVSTGVLDFKTAADNIPFNVPLVRPGYYFIGGFASTMFTARVGTASGNLQVCIGNNGARTNVLFTTQGQVASGFISAVTAPCIGAQFAITNAGFDLVDGTTEIKAKINLGVTGITTLTGRITLTGLWVPV